MFVSHVKSIVLYIGMGIRRVSTHMQKLSENEYSIPSQISGAINYLLDSVFTKWEEYKSKQVYPPMVDPPSHVQELWLECELHRCISLNQRLPLFSKGRTAWALFKLFNGESASYHVYPFLDEYEHKYALKNSHKFRIQYESIPIAVEQSVSLPVYGTCFIQHAGTGKHFVLSIDLCHDSIFCDINVLAGSDDKEGVEQFYTDLNASVIANDIYYRKCLSFTRGKLDFVPVIPTRWDQIILKDDIKNRLRQNTIGVLANSEQFTKLGMSPNRNALLISPPGMAKTTIFRAISCEISGQMTTIWCTGKSIEYPEHVTALFEAARSLTPCIIFIEDMDLFGRERISLGSGSSVLNEFLACLDGAESNTGVVVMASTNDFDSMDEALADRPGRFDLKEEIPLPDFNDRSEMLKSFLKSYNARPDSSVTQETWTTIINMVEGLTGAYIKDLANSIMIRAVSSNCMTPDGLSVVFTTDNITGAAEQVMKNYLLGKRVKRHHQTDPQVLPK